MGLASATCVPLFSLFQGGTMFASLQHVFHRWLAWVLQGCNKCALGCGTGFATCTCVPFCFTCVPLFVFHFICFFWYGPCLDLGRQHLPILTICLAFDILLFQLIKQGTFDTLDK